MLGPYSQLSARLAPLRPPRRRAQGPRCGPDASACRGGRLSALAGAFGHNWVHQPKYKHWAYLSLDTIGFSSDGWFREHVLQHHM